MPDNIIPFPDEDPMSSADSERILGALNDPLNRLFPAISPLNEMLRDARKARKLTQQQLAARLKTDQSNVSKWESGEAVPQQDTILRIAGVLGIDATILLRAREFERLEPAAFGVDPRLLMVADRLAKLEPTIQEAILVVFDGIVRLAEVIMEVVSSKKSD